MLLKFGKRSILFVSFFIFIYGCVKVGPDYKQPDYKVQDSWNNVDDPALVPTKSEIINWWEVFNDPLLSKYINQASESNLDLKIAIARVNEAKARLGVVTGGRYPVVGVGGEILNGEMSENVYGPGSGKNQTYYSGSFDAAWEIDLFGKISRSVESAAAEYQATEEDRNDVMISLYAEIANTYITIRTLQSKIKTVQNNIKVQQQAYDLAKARFDSGITSELDVSQAERLLANSYSQIPPLKIELNKAINTMALLLGKQPGALSEELLQDQPIPVPPETVATGVPADILRQRPDIRSAERRLAAQTARIGVAKADLYPSFSLVGSIGYQSFDAGDFFSPESFFFSIGPTVRWNFFQGGRVREQIKVEDARTEQLLLTYEKTILGALNEAENAFTSFIQQRVQYKYLIKSVEASRKSVKIATHLYGQGLTNFQNVLDAQRELINSENNMVDAQGKASANLVRLYKALGGGWDPDKKIEQPAGDKAVKESKK
jgi:NodT family efflux transporter outer membrane factor (OMF) lipoprotein